MKNIFSMILCVFLVLASLAGCYQAPESVDPMIHNLDTTMYCFIVSSDGTITEQYKSQLVLSITDYAKDEDYINITLPLPQDFNFTTNHEDVSFTIEHEEENLTYYCMKANLYDTKTQSLVPFDFAIDLEAQCMILKPVSNEDEYYLVASSNRFIQPDSIIQYFDEFFALYDHSE